MLNKLKVEFIDRLDPDNAYLHQAIRTALAALLALIVYRYSHWLEGYWIVLAAAFLMQTRLGETQAQQMFTLTLSGICAAGLAYGAGFFWQHTLLLAFYLAGVSFATVFIGLLNANIAICGFFVNLFAIMSAGIITTTAGQLERSLMILLGVAFTLLASLLWPTQPLRNWHQAVKIYLLGLAEFNETLSRSYLHPEYYLKKKKFENVLHERRNRLLRLLNAARQTFQGLQNRKQPEQKIFSIDSSSYCQWKNVQDKRLVLAEDLFIAVIALGNIRHNLTEQFTLDLFKEDLSCIHHTLSTVLRAIAENELNIVAVNLDLLQKAINKLKEKIKMPELVLRLELSYFMCVSERMVRDLREIRTMNFPGDDGAC